MTKTFEALASGETLEIRIYGAIGAGLFFGGITAQTVADAITHNPGVKQIVVKFNSPGGDAFEGMAIRSVLASQTIDTIAEIESVAASAASVAAMGCKTVRMHVGSALMIHEASGSAREPMDSKKLKKLSNALETLNDGMAAIYSKRTGLTKKACRTLMADETWMTAEQAVKDKFADVVLDGDADEAVKVAAAFDFSLFGYQHVPAQFRADADGDDSDESDGDTKDDTQPVKHAEVPPPAAPPPAVDPPAQVPPQSAASAEANAATRMRLDTMTVKLIAAAAGLPADVEESAVITAVSQLHAFAGELKTLTKAASFEAVMGAIRGLQAAAEQLPVLTAKVDEQAKLLEDQKRAQLIAADKTDPKGRKLTPALETFWASQPLAAFEAFLSQAPHIIQMQGTSQGQQQPAPAANGGSQANVLKHNGKAWEEMDSMQKHELYFSAGGQEIYEALKANHVERGEPRAQSQQQRASA